MTVGVVGGGSRAIQTTTQAAAASGGGTGWASVLEWDFAAQAAADLSGGGTVVVGDQTFTVENEGRAAVLQFNGVDGLEYEVDTACAILSGTCPGLYTPLSGMVTADRHSELYLAYRLTLPGARGIVGVTLRRGSEYLCGAARHDGVKWIGYGLAGSAGYTNYNTALSGTTDVVIGLHIRQGSITIEDRGAWTGAYPTQPGGTEHGTIGEREVTNKSATQFNLANPSDDIQVGLLAYYATGATTQATFHGACLLARDLP